MGNMELIVRAGSSLLVLMKVQTNGRGTKSKEWYHLFLTLLVSTLKYHIFHSLELLKFYLD